MADTTTGAGDRINNVVLVHGGFVDGSGWEGVYADLVGRGYKVGVAQHPTVTLMDDVRVVRALIDKMGGPVILVGHSYGGAVITEAGNDDNVAGLVFVSAFSPDTGEAVQDLFGWFPQDGPLPPILPPRDGFMFLDQGKFAEAFAGDVEPAKAAFMGASQVPWGTECLSQKITNAAWHDKPSWRLVTNDDRMINPVVQKKMGERDGSKMTETRGSHATFLSNPGIVASLIDKAARGVGG